MPDQKKSSSQNTSAPSAGSGKPPEPHSHGGLGIGGGQRYLLSAKTCLELLPKLSEKQITSEIAILETLDATIHHKLAISTRSANVTERKRDLLRTALRDSLSTQVDSIVDKYDSLARSICRSLEEADRKLEDTAEELNRLIERHRVRQEQREDHILQNNVEESTPDTGNMTTEQPDEEPVRLSELSFADISYETVRESFVFGEVLPGNRECAYFGKTGYSYGAVKHDPAPYPESHAILDRIFAEISAIDASFTRDNFTCLVQHYETGTSSINMHSDDERVIAPGSNIYTVSFGATRTARFFNTVGPLQNIHLQLTHGTLHVMTQSD
jgi:alkylated DNA repair dioxygenase AlkB